MDTAWLAAFSIRLGWVPSEEVHFSVQVRPAWDRLGLLPSLAHRHCSLGSISKTCLRQLGSGMYALFCCLLLD